MPVSQFQLIKSKSVNQFTKVLGWALKKLPFNVSYLHISILSLTLLSILLLKQGVICKKKKRKKVFTTEQQPKKKILFPFA